MEPEPNWAAITAAIKTHAESVVVTTGGGTDRNCLTYWFPRLAAAGAPVPRTEVVDAGDDWRHLMGLFDSPAAHPESHAKAQAILTAVVAGVQAAADRIGGGPVFLRTGQGSGKHNFDSCCRLVDPDDAARHVAALVEWSETVDVLGLSYRFWCVREMLPVRPVGFLPAYGGMPLVPEVRCFVRGGRVVCSHAYWPEEAVRRGLCETQKPLAPRLARMADPTADRAGWLPLAERVAGAFAGDGAWSVDLLPTDRGWVVTDMAEAGRSFHWEGCPHAGGF